LLFNYFINPKIFFSIRYPSSPAELAGLNAHSDYIIGAPLVTLREKDDLFQLVQRHIGTPLELYVYNTDLDTVRDVMIIPSNNWGGEGWYNCISKLSSFFCFLF